MGLQHTANLYFSLSKINFCGGVTCVLTEGEPYVKTLIFYDTGSRIQGFFKKSHSFVELTMPTIIES